MHYKNKPKARYIWTLDCHSLVFFLSKDGVIDNRSCRDRTMHCVLASSVTKKSKNPSQNKQFKIYAYIEIAQKLS